MEIGRKIYYQISTGNVLVDMGERSGSVIETTLTQDFETYTALQGIQQSAVGVIQCDYGYMRDNFSKYPYHVDITKAPIDETAIVWDVNNPYGATLADIQKSKIAQIQDFYNQALEAGFTSSVSGTATTFGYGQTDQMKFMQLMLAMNNNLLTYPVNVPAKDNTLVSFTQTQLQQLFQDINTFAWTQQNKLHTLIGQVNAATTVDAVNAIAW